MIVTTQIPCLKSHQLGSLYTTTLADYTRKGKEASNPTANTSLGQPAAVWAFEVQDRLKKHGSSTSAPGRQLYAYPGSHNRCFERPQLYPNHIEKALVLPAFIDSVPRQGNNGWAAGHYHTVWSSHNLASCHQAKYTKHANSHPLDRQLRPSIRISRPTSFET